MIRRILSSVLTKLSSWPPDSKEQDEDEFMCVNCYEHFLMRDACKVPGHTILYCPGCMAQWMAGGTLRYAGKRKK